MMLTAIRKIHEAPKMYQKIKKEPVKTKPRTVSDKLVGRVLLSIKKNPGITRKGLITTKRFQKEGLRTALKQLERDKKITKVAYGLSGKNTLYAFFEFGKNGEIQADNKKTKDHVLKLLTRHGMTNKELMAALKITKYKISVAVKELVKDGKVVTATRICAQRGTEHYHTIKRGE